MYIYIHIYIHIYIYICIYVIKKTENLPSVLLSVRQRLDGNSCTWADDLHDTYYIHPTSAGFEHSVCYV